MSVATLALLLSGCTSDDEPEETATPTPTSSATETPAETPSATPTGTEAPKTATPTPTGTADATPTEDVDRSDDGNADDGGEVTADDAVDVLDQYFSAIGTRDFEAAYGLWRGNGEASGQTYEEFVAGYSETASITWEIGEPGRIDPGAGQRYIEIPVEVVARLASGEEQRFQGSYVLHHTAPIEGASEEDQQWRLHSAEVAEVE